MKTVAPHPQTRPSIKWYWICESRNSNDYTSRDWDWVYHILYAATLELLRHWQRRSYLEFRDIDNAEFHPLPVIFLPRGKV